VNNLLYGEVYFFRQSSEATFAATKTNVVLNKNKNVTAG
jgi:hypothetical protein